MHTNKLHCKAICRPHYTTATQSRLRMRHFSRPSANYRPGRFEFEFEFDRSPCPPEEDGRRHACLPSRSRVLLIDGRAVLLLPLLKFTIAMHSWSCDSWNSSVAESKRRTLLAVVVASSVFDCIHRRARASQPFIAIAIANAIAIAIAITITIAAALSHRDDIFEYGSVA